MAVLGACSGERPPCEVVSGANLPPALREASGVAVDGAGRAWVHADSGEPVLLQVDDEGRAVHELRIRAARVDDWEDLAIGPCPAGECFYIGQIGDNLHERTQREILRAAVPADISDTPLSVERLPFRYPDGPSDAEALVALADGSLLVVTKGRNRAAGVYRLAPPFAPDSVRTLEHVQDLSEGLLQLPEQITGGAARGDVVVLRSYRSLRRYAWTGDSLVAAAPPIDLHFLAETQGEGIGIAPDGALILVSEGQSTGSVARLRCAD